METQAFPRCSGFTLELHHQQIQVPSWPPHPQTSGLGWPSNSQSHFRMRNYPLLAVSLETPTNNTGRTLTLPIDAGRREQEPESQFLTYYLVSSIQQMPIQQIYKQHYLLPEPRLSQVTEMKWQNIQRHAPILPTRNSTLPLWLTEECCCSWLTRGYTLICALLTENIPSYKYTDSLTCQAATLGGTGNWTVGQDQTPK